MIIFTFYLKRMIIPLEQAPQWSLCQVGTRLTLGGSSTHWYLFLQLHESWASTLHRCLQKEGKNAIKVAPHFYLSAKMEKVLRPQGWENTVRHCHLSSRGLFLLNTVTSWTTPTQQKKKKKSKNKVSPWNLVKERKEREEEEEKVAGTGLCSHLFHWCLEGKHPGVIRRDVTSGFHHGSASCALLPSRTITPALLNSLPKQHCRNLRSLSASKAQKYIACCTL